MPKLESAGTFSLRCISDPQNSSSEVVSGLSAGVAVLLLKAMCCPRSLLVVLLNQTLAVTLKKQRFLKTPGVKARYSFNFLRY